MADQSYLVLDGAGDWISTPDAAAFSALDDFSIVFMGAANDWTPSAARYFGAHATGTGNQRSWDFLLNTDGKLRLELSTNGSTYGSQAVSSVTNGVADGALIWILAVRAKAAGTVKFYTAPVVAGTSAPPAIGSFTQLGTTVSGMTTATLFNSTAVLGVAANADDAATNAFPGKIYRSQLYTGIFGSGSEVLVRDCNPNDWTSGSTWVSASTGETWTLNGGAAISHLRILAENAGATDAIARALTESRALAEVAGATATVARALTESRALTENAGATDAIARALTESRALAEVAGATATVAQSRGLVRSLAEVAGATAAVASALAEARALAEVAGATESIVAAGDQFGRPISDLATGSWTVVPLWSKVDEVTADDSDFISSEVLAIAGTTSFADLGLTALSDPISNIDHQMSLRAKATFTLGALASITMELREGTEATSALVATLTASPSTSYQTFTYILSGAEASSIVDYTQLFVRLYGTFGIGNLGGVQVSWVQLDTPVASTVLHGRELFEVARATATVARMLAEPRAISEVAGATEAIARGVVEARSLAEAAGATAAVARSIVETRTLSEVAGATATVARSLSVARPLSEAAGATATVARAVVESRSLSAVAGATDSIAQVSHVEIVVGPTATQLLDFDVIASRVESVRFDLLDQQLGYVGQLAVDKSFVPQIVNDVNRPVRRTLENFRLAPRTPIDLYSTLYFATEVDVLNQMVRPVWVLGFGGDGYEFNLGVFQWADDSRRPHTYGRTEESTLVDQNQALVQTLSESVSYAAGQSIHDALVERAAFLGLPSVSIDATSATLAGPASWVAGQDTEQAVFESLCAAAGFYAPYFDNDGTFICRAAPNLASATPTITYAPGGRIWADTLLESNDLLNAPNRYVVVDNSVTAAPLVGVFDVPASAPHSFENRGRHIIRSTTIQGLQNQTLADQAAAALYAQDSATYSWLSFDSTPDPRHDTFDIVGVTVDVGGEQVNYREQGWTLPLVAGSRHNHDLRGTYQ